MAPGSDKGEEKPSVDRLMAENAELRRELARYRTIFELLPLGVYVYRLEDRSDDRSLLMVAANPAVEPLAGVAPKELIGRTLDTNFPGLRAQGLPQTYAEVVRMGAPFTTEVVYGDERVVESAFNVQALPLPNNELCVFFDNITVHKQTERELRRLNEMLEAQAQVDLAERDRSRDLLRHVLEASPSAVYLKDLEGRFLLLNQRAADVMGHPVKELLDKADYELFPVEYVTHWRAAEAEVLRLRRSVDQEEQAPLADGIHTFLSSRAPVFDEEGEIFAISGVSTDITERIAAEAELRHSQQLLQTLFDHLPVGMMLKAAEDGRYVLWNEAASLQIGPSAAEALGKTDHEIFAKALADELLERHQLVVKSRQPLILPEELVTSPKLGPIILSVTRVPIFNEQGEPIYVLILTADVTGQRRAADERAALQTQIIEAQQNALRELSTPLLSISGRVVLMPIVGAVDSRRAQQVLESLLQGVAQHNAEIAIVDITGVQVVDTQVANAFIQAARAVQLLGARVILTGIRPEVAQTLVELGVDLSSMITRGSLQDGIAYGLRISGMGRA